MTYRHITNLRTPFDGHDQNLLVILGDYKLSLPILADPLTTELPPVDVATMQLNGIVGLYVKLETTQTEDFKNFTGWIMTPEAWEIAPALV